MSLSGGKNDNNEILRQYKIIIRRVPGQRDHPGLDALVARAGYAGLVITLMLILILAILIATITITITITILLLLLLLLPITVIILLQMIIGQRGGGRGPHAPVLIKQGAIILEVLL